MNIPHRKAAYHHGNLRAVLIESAHRLIAAKGPEGFTLAEACRLAGVSTAAPYRHFADREDLVRAVALRGFDLLAERSRRARDAHRLGSIDAIVAMGQAYVRFAADEPALFRLMFGRRHAEVCAASPDPEGKACFGVLLDAVAAFLTENEHGSDDLMSLALPLWTIVHGAASLLIDQDFDAVAPGTDVDALVDTATRSFLTGFVARSAVPEA